MTPEEVRAAPYFRTKRQIMIEEIFQPKLRAYLNKFSFANYNNLGNKLYWERREELKRSGLLW